MADTSLTPEDEAAIKSILLQHKAEGNANPLLPADVDIDGDGIADAFGLDANENVVVVSGAKLEDTVYVSDGDDISGGGE